MVVGTKGIWWRILKDHGAELIGFFLISVAVSLAYHQLRWTWLAISTVPLTITGAALGILLGFRSNEAYNRYNEARTLWGAIVNASRTATRQILTLISSEPESEAHELHRDSIYLVIAFPHALRCQLWRSDASEFLRRLIPESDLTDLLESRDVPDAILHEVARRVQIALARNWLHPMHAVLIHDSVRDLSNAQGGCERIKSTPIPRTYTFVSDKLVSAYCLALPFGFAADLGAGMPLVVLLIAFVYLMLNNFATQIEDPFCTTASGLPLLSISRAIEIKLRQRLGESKLPEEIAPVDNVLR